MQVINEKESITYREEVRPEDREAVGRLVRATGFFSEEENAHRRGARRRAAGEGRCERLLLPLRRRGGPAPGLHLLRPDPRLASTASTSTGSPWTRTTQGRGLGRSSWPTRNGSWRSAGRGGSMRTPPPAPSTNRPAPSTSPAAILQEAFLADFYAPGDGKVIFVKACCKVPDHLQ